MVVEGVERTASAKILAEFVDGAGVDMGGAGRSGAEEAIAGAEEDGLNSGAGTMADLACPRT